MRFESYASRHIIYAVKAIGLVHVPTYAWHSYIICTAETSGAVVDFHHSLEG
jgi:hypothetical protein